MSLPSQAHIEPSATRISIVYLLITIGLLGGVFFIAEHQPTISLRPDFVAEIDVQESWSAGGNRLRQVGFLALGSFGVFGLLFGKARQFRLNSVILFGLAYVAWAGVSFAWSIDPGTTARRYVVMLCCVSAAFGIGRLLTMQQIILAAFFVFAAYLVLGVGVEFALGAFRPLAADYRFAGTVHPNTQGAYLSLFCIACLTLVFTLPKYRWVWWSAFAVAFAFLLLTKSRTASAAMLLSAFAMWVVASSPRRTVLLSLGATWIFSVVLLLFVASGFDPLREYSEILLMGREEDATSLTGRIPLWTDLWRYGRQNPLMGYGYAAFWNPRHIYEISTSQEWTISEAHSSYVDGLLQLGLVGVALLVATALSGIVHAAMQYQKSTDISTLFLVAGLVFCLLRGLSESGMGSPMVITMFLAAALISKCSFASETNTVAATYDQEAFYEPEPAVP